MFGDTIDNHITMFQRVVALARDLVLAVGAGLTVLILVLGGNPAKLNVLDFVRLGSAAFLVVIGPAAIFLVSHILYGVIHGSLDSLGSLILPTTPLPKGISAWMSIQILGHSRREYVKRIRSIKALSAEFATRYPRLFQFIRRAVGFFDSWYATQLRVMPYLYTLIALIITVIMFRTVLREYLPS